MIDESFRSLLNLVQSYEEAEVLPNYAQNKIFAPKATVPQHFMLSPILLIYLAKV